MASPMNPLPTTADDPRLKGWYHTIDLAPGITTTGAVYDLRTTVDRVGLPESMAGMSALDVGTAEGFWAFEMERRGADRVVAVDIARLGESDVLPSLRATLPDWWAVAENYCAERFLTARAMRNSLVEYRPISIYRLSPEAVGTFDVVYCGSLLVHLFNPLQALINIRSVTRGTAFIEVCTPQSAADPLEAAFPDRPFVQFGSLDSDKGTPGKHCMYWYFTRRAITDMLIYAGFGSVELTGQFRITGPGGNLSVLTLAAHVEAGKAASPAPVSHVAPSYQQLRDDLESSRREVEALKAQLAPFEGLGPRSIGVARRLQRANRRLPRVASTLLGRK